MNGFLQSTVRDRMKKIILVLFFESMLVGSKVATIESTEMKRIEAESLERYSGLSRYAYPWTYVGSDQGYDYVFYSGVIGDRDFCRIEKGKLNVEERFGRTKDESKWIPIHRDGSPYSQKPLKSEAP